MQMQTIYIIQKKNEMNELKSEIENENENIQKRRKNDKCIEVAL